MIKSFLIILMLLSSGCASRITINADYGHSKETISKYFKDRVEQGLKSTKFNSDKKLKSPFYEAYLKEESGLAIWRLNLGNTYSKADAVLPKMLELELVKKGPISKLYATIKKHSLFTSERLRADEKEWLERFKRLIEQK